MSRRKERATPWDTGSGGAAHACLVVDDEADIRELLELTLLRMGLDVDTASTVAEARQRLDGRSYELCLTDMRLPDGDGLELVRYIDAHCGDLPVAVITAHGSMENAVAALKAGAFDYLAKPLSLEQLRTLVRSALDLPQAQAARGGRHELLGESPALEQVREMIAKISRSQAPVHITGESGSGKELAARLIHEHSPRAAGPFVPVNCGAIPENLVESEFFGYRKGAFTGAEQDREGFFQAANGGTLFLDEVADLPLGMQVKLLRVIQEKMVRKVGSTQELPVDVRIISATHQDLAALVGDGRFRQDLFYRLNVIELRMPPLRELREDIPRFAVAILERLGGGSVRLEPDALEALQRYDFPGNVRELENILERATALSGGGAITRADLQLTRVDAEAAGAESPAGNSKWPLQDFLDRVEREAILEALAHTANNRTAAAKLLGITFRALRYRMERLGLR